VLLFGTGGFAYGKLTVTTANLSESHTSFGRVGGEVNFAQHWSAKAEWLYQSGRSPLLGYCCE